VYPVESEIPRAYSEIESLLRSVFLNRSLAPRGRGRARTRLDHASLGIDGWTDRCGPMTPNNHFRAVRPGGIGSRTFQLAAAIKAAINFVARPPVDGSPLPPGAD